MTFNQQQEHDQPICKRITAILHDGVFPPGSQIVAANLANRLDVSITPVREALARLSGLGVVKICPGRGYLVRAPDAAEMIDMVDMLYRMLDLAITKGISNQSNLTIPLSAILDRPSDASNTAHAIEMFHCAVNGRHDNVVLADMIDSLIDRSGYAFRLFLQPESIREAELADVRSIAEALDTGDAQPYTHFLNKRRQRFVDEAERIFQASLLHHFRYENADSA